MASTAADRSIVDSGMGRIFRFVANRNAHLTPIDTFPAPSRLASSISSRLNLKFTVKFRPFPSGRLSLPGMLTCGSRTPSMYYTSASSTSRASHSVTNPGSLDSGIPSEQTPRE